MPETKYISFFALYDLSEHLLLGVYMACSKLQGFRMYKERSCPKPKTPLEYNVYGSIIVESRGLAGAKGIWD